MSTSKLRLNPRTTHYAPRFTPHARFARLWRHLPSLLLTLLILSYTIYFSWYSINRHNTLHSYAADLSLIDQPMWNTVIGPGDFMELTWGDHQQPRLAEHFEPILVPLAALFYLWDDVRILLIAQSIALALGALPVYWIARKQLSVVSCQSPGHPEGVLSVVVRDESETSITNYQSLISNLPSWAALAFAAAYLLYPHLQAANIADFHADPFVVAPLLLAFWYASEQRWGWMWLWAIVAMATKETLPPLTAMLGVWLLMTADRRRPTASQPAVGGRRSAVWHGLALILISTAWFLGATYLIVAPLARQYFGSDSPIYFASRYTYADGLAGLVAVLQDPVRWHYVFGLFAAAGFLPLLAPELLLLGLPVLAANFLSSFPGQHSGEQHYSAPLAAAFILAAIYGTRRLVGWASERKINGQPLKTALLINAMLWLLSWSLGYHALHGWTPLSLRTETYAMSPTAARLPDLLQAIPPQAVVSASAAIHPHLAHRRVIYLFPTVQDADYLLVDVADIPGVHPNDAHTRLMDMLNHDWRLLQADHGLILAQKLNGDASLSPAPPPSLSAPLAGAPEGVCPPALPLPCSFYNFAHAATPPTYPTDLAFGDGRLRLLGYDLHDDPDNGLSFRFYWQTSAPLPTDLRLWPLLYDDGGRLLSDPAQVPMIAPLWYPPAAWQPGETIITETLPQLLPDAFHLGLAVGPPKSWADPSQRFPVTGHPAGALPFPAGRWVQLASFQRKGPLLQHLPATLTFTPLTPVDLSFGPGLRLTGYWLDPANLRPDGSLSILLQWNADAPLPTDLTVFVHLLGPDGQRVAQSDAYPTWLTPQPTSQWPPNRPILDSHSLSLPPHLPPGAYTLQIGLYNLHTSERLHLPDGSDVFTLGQIQIE